MAHFAIPIWPSQGVQHFIAVQLKICTLNILLNSVHKKRIRNGQCRNFWIGRFPPTI